MSNSAISQRLKLLIDKLDMDTRTFSQALGVSEGTTRNYFNRGSKPNSDYLEKLHASFELVNLHWLLTGDGEPFLFPPNANNQTTANAEKIFRSPIVGTNHGTAYQENNATPAPEMEALKNKLALAENEVEHLKAQLATTNALLDAKNEMLTLLRITYNRPN